MVLVFFVPICDVCGVTWCYADNVFRYVLNELERIQGMFQRSMWNRVGHEEIM